MAPSGSTQENSRQNERKGRYPSEEVAALSECRNLFLSHFHGMGKVSIPERPPKSPYEEIIVSYSCCTWSGLYPDQCAIAPSPQSTSMTGAEL